MKTSRADIVTEKPGPRGRTRNVRTEMEAFQLFMDDSILEFVTNSTNHEVEQYKKHNSFATSPSFQEISINEIKALVGLLLYRVYIVTQRILKMNYGTIMNHADLNTTLPCH